MTVTGICAMRRQLREAFSATSMPSLREKVPDEHPGACDRLRESVAYPEEVSLMAILHVTETTNQTIHALADLHEMTPEVYIEAVFAGRVDLEADLETLEVMADPEAMAAIEEDLAAMERGEEPEAIPWETFKQEQGW
jgi:hypothetical protein